MRAVWEDIYLAETKSSFAGASIDSAPKTFIAGGVGTASNTYALPLTANPNFATGMSPLTSEKMAGVLVNQAENYAAGSILPSTNFALELDARTLGFLAWLFFQKGAEEEIGHPFKQKTFTVPDSSECEVWSTLCRVQSANQAMSEIIDGAICKSLSIGGAEGGALTLKADMVGRSYSNAFNISSQSSLFNYPESRVCLFQNMSIAVAGYTVNFLQSFDMSLENGAWPRYYGSGYPYDFRLGKMTGSLTFTLPLDQNTNLLRSLSMTNPATVSLTIGGGVLPESPTPIHIEFAGIFQEPQTTGQDELQVQLQVDLTTLIGDADSPIVIVCDDNVSRGIL